jgi:hypothetical protein
MLARNLPSASRRPVDLPPLVARAWRFSPLLVIFVAASALLLVVGVVGMLVDPRIVVGMPNWAKSVKFGISLSLYGLTLLWMLPLATRWPRLTRFVAGATGAILLLEIGLLAFQATRGRAIHFNIATPLDETLWTIMGISIGVFWLVTVLGAGLLLFQRFPNPVLAWSVRLGFLLVLLGFTQGFLMTGPNAVQAAALDAGQRLDLVGAHTVGGFDGGPGLPLLGWSLDHGDLRVGHFVGIHSLQVMLLLGALLLSRPERWLTTGHRLALVWTGALAYLGLVALVTWQALRDQPLLAPDALTLGALAALVAATAGIAGVVLWHGRRRESTAALAP